VNAEYWGDWRRLPLQLLLSIAERRAGHFDEALGSIDVFLEQLRSQADQDTSILPESAHSDERLKSEKHQADNEANSESDDKRKDLMQIMGWWQRSQVHNELCRPQSSESDYKKMLSIARRVYSVAVDAESEAIAFISRWLVDQGEIQSAFEVCIMVSGFVNLIMVSTDALLL
jgi:hypothetical protein